MKKIHAQFNISLNCDISLASVCLSVCLCACSTMCSVNVCVFESVVAVHVAITKQPPAFWSINDISVW